jgi:flagellin-like protein
MKANRKFIIKADERAVSAVIGVILMVAITVAIAATVYVYVSGMIGGTKNQTPNVAFTTDSTNNKMTIATSDANIKWSDVVVTLNPACTGAASGYKVYYGGGATAATAFNSTVNPAVPTGTTVTAGDYIFLASGTISQQVQITLRYIPTNSLLGTWTINV